MNKGCLPKGGSCTLKRTTMSAMAIRMYICNPKRTTMSTMAVEVDIGRCCAALFFSWSSIDLCVPRV